MIRLRASHIKWMLLVLTVSYTLTLYWIRMHDHHQSGSGDGNAKSSHSAEAPHVNLQRYINDERRDKADTERLLPFAPLTKDSPIYSSISSEPPLSSFSSSSSSSSEESSREHSRALPRGRPAFLYSRPDNILDMYIPKSVLPAFAADESEFVFGSLIERTFNSYDLHLTTFLLCHYMLEPSTSGMGVEKVHPIMKDKWKRAATKFRDISYYPSGKRLPTPQFFCRIRNSAAPDSAWYTVKGFFVPNRLTSDSNANRRLDILRCAMQDARGAHQNLAGTSESVSVELLRGNASLLNFTVPWQSRRVGYLFSHPPAASRLDMWAGVGSSSSSSAKVDSSAKIDDAVSEKADEPIPNRATGEVVHVCIPGTRQYPSKASLPVFLEFVSHHLLLGASHIDMPVLLGWSSPHMAKFIDVFHSYIAEGRLTIGSQSGDNIDMVYSLAGMTWNKNSVKIFQSNACLYSAKGQADYLLLIDVDEFFVPRVASGYTSLLQVIRAVEADFPVEAPESPQILEEIKPTWAGGRGLADGEAHPLCYMLLSSEVYVNRRSGQALDEEHPWMGDRFSHGAEMTNENKVFRFQYHKPIFPTAKIFQAGINTGGACQLDPGWTDCGVQSVAGGGASKGPQSGAFCGEGNSEPRRMGRMKNGQYFDFRGTHNFDELVTESDARAINANSEAVLFHFLLYHELLSAVPESLMNSSDYTAHFFRAVQADLRARSLDILVLIPDEVKPPGVLEDEWAKFFSKDDIQQAASFNSIKAPLAVVRGRYNPPMPHNFSARATEVVVPLPYFSIDFSEYILGGMIERVSDSFDLYLTTFFLCHGLMEPRIGLSAVSGEKINRDMIDIWKRTMRSMEKTKYYDNGMREGPPYFYCRITHGSGYKPYTVRGQWVPSRLTPDSNSNRRMDIFRCKMSHTDDAYKMLARSSEEITVQIIRDRTSLLTYKLPWHTRTTGYMLGGPNVASGIDPWKGYDPTQPGKWTHDRLYMCVPGLETPPSKTTLPLYLEFVQHHMLLGVDHFFLSALFSWTSPHMKLLLRVFDSFIQEGKLSFSSSAGDGFDSVYSTAGLQWGRDNVKNFQVNMCTYFAKGMADYVGIWDFDEHFIPLGNNSNILDLLDSIESPVAIPYMHGSAKNTDIYPFWAGGRGLADKDGHPLCYIILNSVVTLFAQAHTAVSPEHPWLGERFAHGAERNGHGLGFKKSIRPTRTIFQGGLHLAGACRLPKPWNGCAQDVDFCYNEGIGKGQVFRLTKFPNGTAINFNLNHRFDEITLEQDAYTTDIQQQAVVIHMQYHRFWFGASAEALRVKSPYTSRFFPAVYAALDARDLVLPISLPELQQKPFPLPDHNWVPLVDVHKKIDAERLANPSGTRPDQGEASPQGALALEDVLIPSFSTRLPQFASDMSELVLGSIIEREADSFNLYLTTFMLSHPMIEPKEDGTQAHRIKNESLPQWTAAIRKFKEAEYLPNGKRRRSPKYLCKITNYAGAAPYLVQGDFVPNRLTPDIGANRRLDTLRCKMDRSEEAYRTLARGPKAVQVELLRETKSLLSFSIPWATRTNGDMMQHPTDRPERASKLDTWLGYNSSTPGVWTRDRVHMCVPGVESPPSRKNLPIYLEFLQHHINMGASHIHLTAAFAWTSPHMDRLLRVVKSYVDDGLVSMTSHATDGVDYLYSFRGLSWMRDNIKINQVNMCLYLSKGVADHVAIWDVDEFFIPKGKFTSLLDVIRHTEAPEADLTPTAIDAQMSKIEGFVASSAKLKRHEVRGLWQDSLGKETIRKGFADRDGHPYCYLQMHSEVIPNREAVSTVDMDHLWIGEQFSHGPEPATSRLGLKFSFKKSIIPTRNMFQIGLHMSGACKLPWRWNGCNDPKVEFCYGTTGEAKREPNLDLEFQPFNSQQRFDEIVTDDDTWKIDTTTEAVLYHFMLYRFYWGASNASILATKNDYYTKHFQNTLAGLRLRNLDLLIDLPFECPKEPTADEGWSDYNTVWESRGGSLFGGQR